MPMIAWLFSIIVGRFCLHAWVIHREGRRTRNGIAYGHYYDLHYSKCGSMKSKHL